MDELCFLLTISLLYNIAYAAHGFYQLFIERLVDLCAQI
jgi:hypothetical protein